MTSLFDRNCGSLELELIGNAETCKNCEIRIGVIKLAHTYINAKTTSLGSISVAFDEIVVRVIQWECQ